MDHSRDPCPWVALSDFGGAFCMGVRLDDLNPAWQYELRTDSTVFDRPSVVLYGTVSKDSETARTVSDG
jgi:hypothetical protein